MLCRIADIYETQACAVTLNPALVLYPGKLPVDAAIHALIFRQVNRILYFKTHFLLLTLQQKNCKPLVQIDYGKPSLIGS